MIDLTSLSDWKQEPILIRALCHELLLIERRSFHSTEREGAGAHVHHHAIVDESEEEEEPEPTSVWQPGQFVGW